MKKEEFTRDGNKVFKISETIVGGRRFPFEIADTPNGLVLKAERLDFLLIPGHRIVRESDQDCQKICCSGNIKRETKQDKDGSGNEFKFVRLTCTDCNSFLGDNPIRN